MKKSDQLINHKKAIFDYISNNYDHLFKISKKYVLGSIRKSSILKSTPLGEVENMACEILNGCVIKIHDRFSPANGSPAKEYLGDNYAGYMHTSIYHYSIHYFKRLDKHIRRKKQLSTIEYISDEDKRSYDIHLEGVFTEDFVDPLIVTEEEEMNELIIELFNYADENFDFLSASLFKKRLIDGWSYDKIGEQAGCAKSNVHKKVTAVIEKIKKDFDRDEFFEYLNEQKVKPNDCNC